VCGKMFKTIRTILLVLIIPMLINADDFSQSIGYALQTKINLIVIDPGFGGDKTGPSGCNGKVFAKDINMQITKKVAERIINDPGIKVILTRHRDVDLSLEQRCTIANTEEVD
jgi:N-acetylmuramoyl-L-alanine amidase